MNVWSVVGVRPEFVMAAPVNDELGAAGHDHSLAHTGQHHDDSLSAVFFEQLSLPAPDHHLGVGSASRDEQVADVVDRLAPLLATERPDAVLVYGDTTSTLAGALAAVATATPLVHVEAGLRSGNWEMPEERTRVLVDHLADLRLAPIRDGVDALAEEDVTTGVHHVGDVRADAVAATRDSLTGDVPDAPDARDVSETPDAPDAPDTPDVPSGYVLATVHRAATTDYEATLRDVFTGLARTETPVVLPVHPRTADRLRAFDQVDAAADRVQLIEPVGYAAFLALLDDAAAVATDSGGVQREASYLGTPCVTLRECTEWRGTVRRGRNVLAGTDPDSITEAVDAAAEAPSPEPTCPTGAAEAVVATLERWHDDFVGGD